jgi:hypothetical protein
VSQAQLATSVSSTAAPRNFYVAMALISLLVVAVGFAPSFYLKSWTAAPELPALVHVHDIVFSAWILLFVAQTALVRAGKVAIHRRLGVAGACLAVAMLVLGYVTAIEAARRGHNPAGFRDAMAFLAVPIVDLVVFVPLFAGALWWRNRADIHKRLMLLATLSLLGAAFARFPYIEQSALSLLPYAAFALACPLYDWVVARRVHPAFVWGTVWYIALGASDTWHDFAVWLTS